MPYLAEAEVDMATALANRVGGGALVANDVILAMDIPAKTLIMSAGIEVVTATDGGTLTVDMATAADADAFVDGMDISDSVAAGTMSQIPAATQTIMCSVADTLDITLATQGGAALTSGKLRVWAILCDCTGTVSAGIA
jgi:hypothetical protein